MSNLGVENDERDSLVAGDMSEALSFKVLHRANEIMVSMSINKLKANSADGTWQTIRIRTRPRYLNDLYSMNVLHDGDRVH